MSSVPDTHTSAPISLDQEGSQDIAADIFEPIISLGPNTDVILDNLNMDDSIVPRLRNLAKTVRSGRWEAVLCSSTWGLNHEQASDLSAALLLDIQVGVREANLGAKVSVRSLRVTTSNSLWILASQFSQTTMVFFHGYCFLGVVSSFLHYLGPSLATLVPLSHLCRIKILLFHRQMNMPFTVNPRE